MTTQPTENEARLLLAKAAATIEVDESTPTALTGLPEPPHRRWPVLAAAAAVVVAIGGGLLVAQQAGDDPQPSPQHTPPPVDPPSPSGDDLGVQREAAEGFVAWVRGEGQAPDFADRVRLLDDGGPPFGALTWIAEPTDRRLYSMCSGLPPGQCGIDPTHVIERHEGDVEPARGRALCQTAVDELPSYLGEAVADDVIRLTVPGASCDEDLPVELWVDADGEIYAVNLVFVEVVTPSPRTTRCCPNSRYSP